MRLNCTVTNGTPIVVAAGAMTSGIDFALGSPLTKGDFDGDGKTDYRGLASLDGDVVRDQQLE